MRIKVGVGAAQETLDGSSVDCSSCLVHQGEAPFTILREDKMRIDVNHLAEERSLLFQLMLRTFSLGDVCGGAAYPDHLATLIAERRRIQPKIYRSAAFAQVAGFIGMAR